MFKNLKEKKAFTLLETLIAVFVLGIGVAGAFGSIAQTLSAAFFAKDRLIAAYLAQEGIEIVTNIRDSNWIRGATWTEGIFCCPTPPCICEADYNDSVLVFADRYLRSGVDGFYTYDSGSDTPFKRKINVIREGDDIKIVVRVFRRDRLLVEVTSIITNWFGG